MKKMILMLMAMVVFGNVFAWSDWMGAITKVETHCSYSPVYNPTENVIVVTTSDGRKSWFPLNNDFAKPLLAIILSAKTNGETVTLKVAENQPLVSGTQIYRIHACY